MAQQLTMTDTNSCPISSKHDPVIETCSKLSNPFYSAATPVLCLASAQETAHPASGVHGKTTFPKGDKPRISEQTPCFCKGRWSAGGGSSHLVFDRYSFPFETNSIKNSTMSFHVLIPHDLQRHYLHLANVYVRSFFIDLKFLHFNEWNNPGNT